MMDEKSIILGAINKPKPKINDDDLGLFDGKDAIEEMVKAKKRKESFMHKSCLEWTNLEFLNYIDFMLRGVGIYRSFGSIQRESDYINRIYDRLTKTLKDKMDNKVLRDYLEWWASIFASRMSGREFHLNNLMNELHISKFLVRYQAGINAEVVTPQDGPPVSSAPVKEYTNKEVYDMGGLPMLLIKCGIVNACKLSKQQKGISLENIRTVLLSLTKPLLEKVLSLTVQRAPYSQSDEIDFISLALPATSQHNLVSFSTLKYKDYFKGA